MNEFLNSETRIQVDSFDPPSPKNILLAQFLDLILLSQRVFDFCILNPSLTK